MKIMVYYLAFFISNPSSDQRLLADKKVGDKLTELMKEFPGIKIKVIPAYGADHDHIDVADLTPVYYPMTGTLGPAPYNPTYNPTILPYNPNVNPLNNPPSPYTVTMGMGTCGTAIPPYGSGNTTK